MKKFLGALVIATLGGFAALSLEHFNEKKQLNDTQLAYKPPVKYVNMPVAGAEVTVDFTKAAEMTTHAVVNVSTTYASRSRGNQYYYDPFRDIFGQIPRQQEQARATGSGVIISQDGYIVTNNHVISGADKVEVTLNDKRSYSAEVIGKDPTTDLALLKIKENNLPYIAYGNSDNVKVGEWVLAVGNPFNLTSTVTAGIISAKARSINILDSDPATGQNPIESYLQTDAAVNPGNSGGALVNTKGELIGINSAIASNTGSYTGYSFAIPVNLARKVIADLSEFGEVQRAYIGVAIRDLDYKLAKEKNIKSIQGVYISDVTRGGSAAESGIKPGDIVLKVGEVFVNTPSELLEQVSRYRPGDAVNLTISRNNEEKNLKVVLKNKNGTTALLEKVKSESISSLGAVFEPINKDDMKKFNIAGGVKISKLSPGKLSNAGIKEGFIITHVDKKIVNTAEDIKNILEDKRGGVLLEGVYPNGMRAYYGFGV